MFHPSNKTHIKFEIIASKEPVYKLNLDENKTL